MCRVALRDEAASLVTCTVSTCVVSESWAHSASPDCTKLYVAMASTKRVVDAASNSSVQERKNRTTGSAIGRHRTSSTSLFGRHLTGSVIQRLTSDSCHPVPLVLILS